jgi:hypothetical protein
MGLSCSAIALERVAAFAAAGSGRCRSPSPDPDATFARPPRRGSGAALACGLGGEAHHLRGVRRSSAPPTAPPRSASAGHAGPRPHREARQRGPRQGCRASDERTGCAGLRTATQAGLVACALKAACPAKVFPARKPATTGSPMRHRRPQLLRSAASRPLPSWTPSPKEPGGIARPSPARRTDVRQYGAEYRDDVSAAQGFLPGGGSWHGGCAVRVPARRVSFSCYAWRWRLARVGRGGRLAEAILDGALTPAADRPGPTTAVLDGLAFGRALPRCRRRAADRAACLVRSVRTGQGPALSAPAQPPGSAIASRPRRGSRRGDHPHPGRSHHRLGPAGPVRPLRSSRHHASGHPA